MPEKFPVNMISSVNVIKLLIEVNEQQNQCIQLVLGSNTTIF